MLFIIIFSAVLRCILAYFTNKNRDNLPYLKVPLHTVIKLTPKAYSCEVEMFKFDIQAPVLNSLLFYRHINANMFEGKADVEALRPNLVEKQFSGQMPGEKVEFHDKNIGYLSPISKIAGRVFVTRYRLRFEGSDGDMRHIRFTCQQATHSRRPLIDALLRYAFPVSNKLVCFTHIYVFIFPLISFKRFIDSKIKVKSSLREYGRQCIDGWTLYDTKRELKRLGVPNEQWCITNINYNYEFADTYPRIKYLFINSILCIVLFLLIPNYFILEFQCQQLIYSYIYLNRFLFFSVYNIIYIMCCDIEVYEVERNQNSVLVHCSDGWDRTAQLTSLAMVQLDPFYRSIEGFGHGEDKPGDGERSPVFVQFIDCVWQLIQQKCHKDTISLWSYVLENKKCYLNPLYNSAAQRCVLRFTFQTAKRYALERACDKRALVVYFQI
uniref:Myotubularin phosphatase domain-containing protein n=1 Tax=Heterorhabditis bacteriophora TaxID=37862 RepID=A0A1I7X7C3_HETBA